MVFRVVLLIYIKIKMCSGWSSEETKLLIDLYRNEKNLYNVKSTDYYNEYARQNSLERILRTLVSIKPNVTVNQIEAKINDLRSRYRAELTKLKYLPNESGSNDNKSPFQFFDMLLFLSDHVQARKGEYNISRNRNSPAVEQQEKKNDTAIDTEKQNDFVSVVPGCSWMNDAKRIKTTQIEKVQNVQLATAPQSSREASKKKKRAADTSEKKLVSTGTALKKLSNRSQATIDEWDNFGIFVANSIKKLSKKKSQIKCKHNILRFIMQYEEEQFLDN